LADDVLGERFGQVFHRDEGFLPTTEFQEVLAEGELVGSDVPAEQGDGPPVVVQGRHGFFKNPRWVLRGLVCV
jgi:hypothetical protein